eukprot:GHVL01012876.1.p1 GENE.GHVL01012876.1~~GHVL01012876.1.p1  ORF type:complete len:200 (+),score=30.44 GHVL01012876.1:44-601(+)
MKSCLLFFPFLYLADAGGQLPLQTISGVDISTNIEKNNFKKFAKTILQYSAMTTERQKRDAKISALEAKLAASKTKYNAVKNIPALKKNRAWKNAKLAALAKLKAEIKTNLELNSLLVDNLSIKKERATDLIEIFNKAKVQLKNEERVAVNAEDLRKFKAALAILEDTERAYLRSFYEETSGIST